MVAEAVARWQTPFYLCSWHAIETAVESLEHFQIDVPIRNWLSLKSQPVAPLVRAWRDSGRGIEVVSEWELAAALSEGFAPSDILVNGVAKHTWLSRFGTVGLRVHLDSVREASGLVSQARHQNWRVGVRVHVQDEYDPDEPTFGDQFGLTTQELDQAIEILIGEGVSIESVHFHLRSNVSDAATYARGLRELGRLCERFSLSPRYVDIGGGLPASGEFPLEGQPVTVDLKEFENVLREVTSRIPTTEEIWLENGRFVSSASGVLVVRVNDVKERSDCRYLICDGGRTNNALVSDWERHAVFSQPPRSGKSLLTTICGPSCMSFDRLGRLQMPEEIEVGDYLVWMNAGAYHIPWETRFSRGWAKFIWIDSFRKMHLARAEETPEQWWQVWR